MMFLSTNDYRNWQNKSITLVGMSGVGKTYLSSMLRRQHWFHYSGDYRIGTRYLDEPILDLIKEQAMQMPFLKDLLRNDWISIKNNIKIEDLGPVLCYVGKLGNPERGGVGYKDFVQRQAAYRDAEICAMHDVPHFINKAQSIYGYSHFINDVGGSLCELDNPEVMQILAENSLLLYIKVTSQEEENKLIERAREAPKPLYYRADFLEEQLAIYLAEKQLSFAAEIEPDDFTRWVFPRLFRSRIPRYEAIAEEYGYTVTSEDVAPVKSEEDFNLLIEKAIQRRG